MSSFAALSSRVRAVLLSLLLIGEGIVLVVASNEEDAMDFIVLMLPPAAPFLGWFTIEPEPTALRKLTGWRRLAHFPFQAGGASGVAYFLLVFTLVVGVYVTWMGFHGVWLADDDPVQLIMGALYACVYLLLPVGFFSPFLHRWWGRLVAVAACLASYVLMKRAFPQGPRDPGTLTELGDPMQMIRTVLWDGTLIHYARDDLAVLAGLAALGVLLNAPRVVRRWRAGNPSIP